MKKIIFFPVFLLLSLIILLITYFPQDKTISQVNSCNPDQLAQSSSLSFDNKNEHVRNFNACLNLLGFYSGDISDAYDNKTVEALKKFYVNVRKLDPLEDYNEIETRSKSVGSDVNLIKEMAKMKINFDEPRNLVMLKNFGVDRDYSSFDKLVVDKEFKNILFSYRAKNNKYYLQKINIDSGSNIKFGRFFDGLKEIGFSDLNGNHYIDYFLKNREFLLISTTSHNFLYGPVDNIGDFKIYHNPFSVGIIYSKNRFVYSRLNDYNIGPFTNASNLKLSSFEPKIGVVLTDPRAFEKVGEPTGFYLFLKSLTSSTLISGFGSVSNFDFAEEDDPSVNYGGFVFSYKPLWQNVINPDPNMIENFLKDWLYIEGKNSPCKDFQSYYNLLNEASAQHQQLLSFKNSYAPAINCRINIGASSNIINKDYLEKVINNNYANLLDLNKRSMGPLSICGPYNIIYNLALSPDKKKLAIVYAKDYISPTNEKQIKQGIAVVNLTKVLTLPNRQCNCNSGEELNIQSFIVSCYQDLAKLVYSQSVAQADFYSPVDFDESLGVVFSNDGNRLAFSYRTNDKYHLAVYNVPSVSLVASTSPIFISEAFISPIEIFEFSPDGKGYVFVGEQENIVGVKTKYIYIVYDNHVTKKISNIENLKNIIFSKVNNYVALQYSLEDDANQYIEIINYYNSQTEKKLGPYRPDLDINDILFTGDGSEIAIVLSDELAKKFYLHYKDKIYNMGLGGKIMFSQVASGTSFYYKLLVVYVKEGLQNNERVAKIYFAEAPSN